VQINAEPGAPLIFLDAPGELARLISDYDWAATSIGPLEAWPQSLKTIAGFLIRSPIPIVLLWGEDGVMIYNDAYSVFAGGRHPQLLGSKVREGWVEVADFNDNVMRVGLAGQTLSYRDQELTLYRSGRPEQVWMNLDYSPVHDESDQPAGVMAIVVETTERVQSERRLAAASARLRRQFEQSPSFVIVMSGPDHIVEFVNEAHRALFGSSGWEGRPLREAFPSIAGQGFFEELDRVYETGEVYEAHQAEVTFRRGTDSPIEKRYLSFIYSPLTDDDGAITGVFCDGFDTTETHIATLRRDTLTALSDRLRDMEDPARIALAATTILAASLGATRAGYGVVDEAGIFCATGAWRRPGLAEFSATTDLARFGPLLDRLRSGDLLVIEDAEADGTLSPIIEVLSELGVRSLLAQPLVEQDRLVAMFYTASDQPRHWRADELALIRDVAERTRTAVERASAAARLRDSEGRLRFLDRVGTATAQARDADEILALATRMTAEYLGISNCAYADMDDDEDGFTIRGDWAAEGSPSIVGHYRLTDFGELAVTRLHAGEPLVINDNAVEIAPHEAATFQAIGIRATICMPLIKEGKLTALMAIHDRDPRHWSDHEIATIREVTERAWAHVVRVGAEADLRQAAETLEQRVAERTAKLMETEEALRHAQKMEAVGQLTGGIAHDFNNLLGGITGALEMIERRLAEGRSDAVARYISGAQDSARRAASLTQRLLAFSRRQTLEPKPTDVNRLVAGLEELIRRTVGPAITVEVVGAGGLWLTQVDPSQLESALLNLVINARDAMSDGGRITIETANRWLDGRGGWERGVPPGQYVSLSVTDTGTGMPADVIERAFDPFFTTKPLGQGTGLGLSMVHGFVRQSGGQVRIYSELGQGTTMALYLPRYTGPLEAQEPVRVQGEVEPGRGETVLVIDDEEMVRLLVTDALRDAGYRVLEARDGASGLAVLESDARIDLLITDVGLPGGLNGRQVADAARAARPSLKILFITGYAENAAIGNGYLDAGMGVLTKPFAMASLSARIRAMMGG
jgi:PAS domain S-box-containing protein